MGQRRQLHSPGLPQRLPTREAPRSHPNHLEAVRYSSPGLSSSMPGYTATPAFRLVRRVTSASAPAVDDAGFCPVISLPSVIAKLSQFAFFS